MEAILGTSQQQHAPRETLRCELSFT